MQAYSLDLRTKTKEVLEVYFEHFLAPMLREAQVMVMDNLFAHKDGRVRKLIEERGCDLLYLPPYSPDLNPTEEAFSKVKGLLIAEGHRGPDVGGVGGSNR